ncbi:MAG: chalcone isomerase family protein [Crocinitomicaceae bacterium]|nr:chalcone isomerase family protein [Crocinitomicaceae bacterium]
MKNVLMLFFVILSVAVFGQTKIGGVIMPNIVKAGDVNLKLNGGGIREKMFINLYIGVLYLKEKSSDANKIISADEPMAIKMRVVSSMVSKENMEEAIRTGFDKSTGGNISPIKSKIDELISAGFKDEIAIGDIFDLIYIPGKGTTLHKNNSPVVTLAGLDFKKALFGIWLCNEPADENLKNKMLGL